MIYGGVDAQGIAFDGVDEALAVPGTDLRLFGKPESFARRRMGVAVARADDVDTARANARLAAGRGEAARGVSGWRLPASPRHRPHAWLSANRLKSRRVQQRCASVAMQEKYRRWRDGIRRPAHGAPGRPGRGVTAGGRLCLDDSMNGCPWREAPYEVSRMLQFQYNRQWLAWGAGLACALAAGGAMAGPDAAGGVVVRPESAGVAAMEEGSFIDPQLKMLWGEHLRRGGNLVVPADAARGFVGPRVVDGMVRIEALSLGDDAALADELRRLGAKDVRQQGNLVLGRMPVAGLGALQSLRTARFVRRAPEPFGSVGAVTSQGTRCRAPSARGAPSAWMDRAWWWV